MSHYLGLNGMNIIVRNRKTNEIIAKATFVTQEIDRKICSPVYDGEFSESTFIIRALNLKKKTANKN